MARAVKALPSAQWARFGILLVALVWMILILPLSAIAAPSASVVMDARTGNVIYTENADARLHPASLTKMMTLYIAFEAVEHGEIGLDDLVTISKNAASEPPSKLGARAGSKVKLRYLIRAAAVKSANDAATAIGEAISGSEAAFARRMNRTAKAIGMTHTTFKNAHGLTESGHLSTARDMSVLGRHLLFDYPQYYNIFSRKTADVGGKTVYHTNRRFLSDYAGADGIKTGFTNAAGFNLTASAVRGSERIIVTVFGGTSTANRNAKVAKLMDMGFQKAPSRVALAKPRAPQYVGNAGGGVEKPAAGKTIRVSMVMQKSLRPTARPLPDPAPLDPVQVAALNQNIAQAVALAALSEPVGEGDAEEVVNIDPVAPRARPKTASAKAAPMTAQPDPAPVAEAVRVVARNLNGNDRSWGVNVGRFGNRYMAERALVTTSLQEMETLQGSQRSIEARSTGYDANFIGMTRDAAELACKRLQARNVTCFMVGPS